MGQHRPQEEGFSLLEVMVVIAIMGMLATMAVPLAGHLQSQQRVRETERQLETIRAAMLGTREAFAADGRVVLGGYLGDTGRLPALFPSVWDPVRVGWEWRAVVSGWVYNDGFGQPRGLWANPPVPGAVQNLRWQGPYLVAPGDKFPEDARHLEWRELPQTTAEVEANREFAMRQTEGVLADAWGRRILFFYVDERGRPQREATVGTTVYLVSEGLDRQSHPIFPPYERIWEHNEDNLILSITRREWQDRGRPEEARRQLESLREALVGKKGVTDRLGRPLFGGYVGDIGLWPDLLTWQETGWVVAREVVVPVVGTVLEGQPRGLWRRDIGKMWRWDRDKRR